MAGKLWRRQWLRFELWMVLALITVLIVLFLRSTQTLTTDAYNYRAKQLRSDFTTALRLLRSSWLVAGKPQQIINFTKYGAGNLNLNEEGWPVAVNGYSVSSQVTEEGCREVFTGLLQEVPYNAEQAALPLMRVLAVGTVCVYQFGNPQRDHFSILYNAASGEVRFSHQLRKK